MADHKHTPVEARALWTQALRSGDYEQTQGALHRTHGSNLTNRQAGYCCLGVACDLYQQHEGGLEVDTTKPNGEATFNKQEAFLPDVVKDWLGLQDHGGAYSYSDAEMGDIEDDPDDYCDTSLADKNDDGDNNFTDIANIIESNPVGLFL